MAIARLSKMDAVVRFTGQPECLVFLSDGCGETAAVGAIAGRACAILSRSLSGKRVWLRCAAPPQGYAGSNGANGR